MRLSVLIPASNEEKLLPACLTSVAAALGAHAAPDWSAEVIVADNNSTDHTGELARRAGATVVFEPINQISRAGVEGVGFLSQKETQPPWHPPGEPGQTPEFDEFTVVLKGMLRVTHRGGILDVHAGQAVIAQRGKWVRYSTPDPEGAEYVAVCLPAFSPAAVHRDNS